MTKHELEDDTLKRTSEGIVARCKCGWISRGHFSSLAACVAFMDHQESCEKVK